MRLIIKHVIDRPRHHIKRLLLRSNAEVRLTSAVGTIPLGGAVAFGVRARARLKNLVLAARQISVATFDEAATQLVKLRTSIASTTEVLQASEPWSTTTPISPQFAH